MNTSLASSHGSKRTVVFAAMFACILEVPLGGEACDEQRRFLGGFTCRDGICAARVGEAGEVASRREAGLIRYEVGT